MTRRAQVGLTLIEVMIASAIMVIMMTLAWRTISNTSDSRRTFEKYEERNHEVRLALDRGVRDCDEADLSRNEDTSQTHPRTLCGAKPRSPVPSIRFSTLGHRALWADATESDQTVIEYLSRNDPEAPDKVDWIRREQRRQSNMPPEEAPSDYDVLMLVFVCVLLVFWFWLFFVWLVFWDMFL